MLGVVLADVEKNVYHESRNLYMKIFRNETIAQACFQASIVFFYVGECKS